MKNVCCGLIRYAKGIVSCPFARSDLHSNHYGAQIKRVKNSIFSKFKDLVLLPTCNISFIIFSQFQFDFKTSFRCGEKFDCLHYALLSLVLEVIKIELRQKGQKLLKALSNCLLLMNFKTNIHIAKLRHVRGLWLQFFANLNGAILKMLRLNCRVYVKLFYPQITQL